MVKAYNWVHLSVHPTPNPAWFEVHCEYFDYTEVYRIPAKDELDAYRLACHRAREIGCVVK